MGKINSRFFKNAQKMLCEHSPEILTGLGIAGMIFTTILAVKATPKAVDVLRKEKEERARAAEDLTDCSGEDYEAVKISKPEIVRLTWKHYIPAALTGVCSIACLVGAQSVNARRTAALATAYTLSETALAEFKRAAIDVVGEEKIQEVRDKVAKNQVENKPLVNTSSVIVTGRGNTLCLDGEFGQYFESDVESIRKAVNELNQAMLREQYVSLNDFYDILGIDHIKAGAAVGWNIDKQGMLDVWFSSQLAADGRPCVVMNYSVAPQYDFDRLL